MVCGAAMADEQPLLNVIYADGTNHVVAMTAIERIDISTGGVTVVGIDGREQHHEFSAIDHIDLHSSLSGIASATAAKGAAPKATVTATELSVSGLEAKAQVSVYNVKGQVVASVKATQNGTATFSLNTFGTGSYIVKAQGFAVKFVKK